MGAGHAGTRSWHAPFESANLERSRAPPARQDRRNTERFSAGREGLACFSMPVITKMCFFELNWTACCWQFRIGDRFTDYRGRRSWESLDEIKREVKEQGLVLVKTDSRTYQLACPAK